MTVVLGKYVKTKNDKVTLIVDEGRVSIREIGEVISTGGLGIIE